MRSWIQVYVFFAFVIVGFGGMSIFAGSSMSGMAATEKALLVSGKSAMAEVTRKWIDSDHQSVEYTYLVDGQRYFGLTDPGSTEWAKLEVRSVLPIVYLPSDPKKSDYRPERWLNNESTAYKAGFGIAGIALVGLIATIFADVRRRALGIPIGVDPTPGTTFRMSPILPVFGAIFFLAGLFFQVGMVSQVLNGQGMPVRTSVGGQTTMHMATGPELILWCLFPALFWGIGLAMIVAWRNFQVTLTDDGIRVRNGAGRIREWRWDQITRAKRHQNRGTYYVIGDDFHKVTIPQQMPGAEPLYQTIESHLAPLLG